MNGLVAVVPCRFDPGEPALRLRLELYERGFDHVYLMDDDGLGPAYLKAWSYIAEDAPGALAVHIDVGHDPAETGHLAANAIRYGTDIVIGSRFVKGGGHTGNRKRKYASKAAAFACRTVTGALYQDWTSGLRSYSPHAREVLADYPYTTTGHAWQIEALWAGYTAGLKIKEVPIQYQAGRSSLNSTRTAEAFRLWRKMASSSPASSATPLAI